MRWSLSVLGTWFSQDVDGAIRASRLVRCVHHFFENGYVAHCAIQAAYRVLINLPPRGTCTASNNLFCDHDGFCSTLKVARGSCEDLDYVSARARRIFNASESTSPKGIRAS